MDPNPSAKAAAPAAQVARAVMLLAVARGDDYQTAARVAGRRSGCVDLGFDLGHRQRGEQVGSQVPAERWVVAPQPLDRPLHGRPI